MQNFCLEDIERREIIMRIIYSSFLKLCIVNKLSSNYFQENNILTGVYLNAETIETFKGYSYLSLIFFLFFFI